MRGKKKLLELCSIFGQHADSKSPGSHLRTNASRVSVMKCVGKKAFYGYKGPSSLMLTIYCGKGWRIAALSPLVKNIPLSEVKEQGEV